MFKKCKRSFSTMPKIHVASANPVSKDDSGAGYAWSNFTESTSLHGIKHAFSSSSNKIRRFIWLIGVMGMAAALVYIVTNLAMDYYRYPTTISVVISTVDKIDFPQVTICNLSPFNATRLNGDDLLDNLFLVNSPLNFLAQPFDMNDQQYNFTKQKHNREYYNEISNGLENTFLHCIYEKHYIPCNEVFETKLTDLGVCFATRNSSRGHQLWSTTMTGSEHGLQIYVFADQDNYVHNYQLSAGFKIFLHEPFKEPDINNGFLVSPGFATYVSLKKFKYHYLPHPYKAFGEVKCLDINNPKYKNPLQSVDHYDVTTCYKECRANYMFEKCGCVQYIDIGNESVCSLYEYFDCYRFQIGTFIRNKTTLCSCGRPCDYVNFEIQQSTALFPSNKAKAVLKYRNIRENFAEIRIFYEYLIETEVSQQAVYNLEKIVGVLGGQMGIFLGASLLTLSEFIEYLVMKMGSIIYFPQKLFSKKK